MLKTTKKNNWKIASLILGVFCLSLFSYMIYQDNSNYNFEDYNFQISKEDFNKITSTMDIGEKNKICDTTTSECILIRKIG